VQENCQASLNKSVVVSNPCFGQPDLKTHISCPGYTANHKEMTRTGCWEYLPGTADEGVQIAELLSALHLAGNDATTINLGMIKRPKVLHIATHGYFLPDQLIPEDATNLFGIDATGKLAEFSGEDPMLRSGLVLAGANHPDKNPEDDGYLTALEATHLDLQGTELVTLSACDTGQGDIQTGEGVYGLQRALIVAGARSLLLSLWKVPDDATCDFMVRFYTLLKQGAGRYEALVAVQREFRTHPNPIWRDIHYWGAWQLIGDWRPIQGL
jgi:CHAT domain-containing protein